MSETSKTWDAELVRKWLNARFVAARLEQAAADKRGYEAQDDYDKAAAEEWVCRTLKTAGRTDEQAAFAAQLKELLARVRIGSRASMTTHASIGTSEPTFESSPR